MGSVLPLLLGTVFLSFLIMRVAMMSVKTRWKHQVSNILKEKLTTDGIICSCIFISKPESFCFTTKITRLVWGAVHLGIVR